MKKNYKTIQFMLSALMIAALCACTNDGMESENHYLRCNSFNMGIR